LGWVTKELWLGSWQWQIFFLSNASRLSLGPTQPLTQWILGLAAPEVKWLGCDPDYSQLMLRLRTHGAVHPLHMPLWHAQRKICLCPFDDIKYALVWYESVVLLGMKVSVKMELLINRVEVVVLLQIKCQLMYSTVISVARSSWTKPDLSHILSNTLVPHWSRCFLKYFDLIHICEMCVQ
jgi:hypothetical protein